MFLLIVLAASFVGSACGGDAAGVAADQNLVRLTSARVVGGRVEATEWMVPRAYVNRVLAQKAGSSELTSVHGVGVLHQGLVSGESWPCDAEDLWMADSGWQHYGCVDYDGVPATGICGDLSTFFRYSYYQYPFWYNEYWDLSVRYYWPGNWHGCWTAETDCDGDAESFYAYSSGSTEDPNGSGSGWFTASSTVQAAGGIYGALCPGR